MKKQRDFSVSKNGNEKIPKILQFLLIYLLLKIVLAQIKYVLPSHHIFIVSHDGNNMETKKSRFSKLYNYLPTIYEGIVNNEIIITVYIIYIII